MAELQGTSQGSSYPMSIGAHTPKCDAVGVAQGKQLQGGLYEPRKTHIIGSIQELVEEHPAQDRCARYYPIISVFSGRSKCVLLSMFVVAVWSSMMVPLWMAFPEATGIVCMFEHCLPTESEMKVFDRAADAVYAVCLFMHFFIAYIDEIQKEEVYIPQFVVYHRLRAPIFWVDVASCIPFNTQMHPLVGLVKFARIHRLLRNQHAFQHLQFSAIAQVSHLVANVLFGAHLLAVLWLWSITWQSDSLDSYLAVHFGSDGASAYLMALRDAIFMMINRPITALTDRELLICILMAPIGAIVVAAFFGSINWLFQRSNAQSMENFQELSTVRQTLKAIKIPAYVQTRVINYYRYTQIHDHAKTCDTLFKRVSPTLMLELKLYLYADLLGSAPFFRDVSPSIMKALVLALQLRIYASGDCIICRNDSASDMYFICRGYIEVLPELDAPSIANFGPGQHFGELAMYRGVEANAKRTAWVRAVTFCHLAQLNRDAFNDILEEFPDEGLLLSVKIGDQVEYMDWFQDAHPDDHITSPVTSNVAGLPLTGLGCNMSDEAFRGAAQLSLMTSPRNSGVDTSGFSPILQNLSEPSTSEKNSGTWRNSHPESQVTPIGLIRVSQPESASETSYQPGLHGVHPHESTLDLTNDAAPPPLDPGSSSNNLKDCSDRLLDQCMDQPLAVALRRIFAELTDQREKLAMSEGFLTQICESLPVQLAGGKTFDFHEGTTTSYRANSYCNGPMPMALNPSGHSPSAEAMGNSVNTRDGEGDSSYPLSATHVASTGDADRLVCRVASDTSVSASTGVDRFRDKLRKIAGREPSDSRENFVKQYFDVDTAHRTAPGSRRGSVMQVRR